MNQGEESTESHSTDQITMSFSWAKVAMFFALVATGLSIYTIVLTQQLDQAAKADRTDIRYNHAAHVVKYTEHIALFNDNVENYNDFLDDYADLIAELDHNIDQYNDLVSAVSEDLTEIHERMDGIANVVLGLTFG